jgi:internalin A
MRSAVVSQLGVADDSHVITQADIDDSISWDFSSKSIRSIKGIQHFTNLDSLDFSSNQISDISPLSGLTNLISLYLGSNAISDLSPLRGLKNLDALFLPSNQITDISPLSSLTNIRMLTLSFNSIADASPLARMTNLQYLYLESNQIVRVDSLAGLTNLQELALDHNHIYDISPLAGLVNLANEWGLTLNDQTITLPIITIIHGALATKNPVTSTDGSLVSPTTISDAGVYSEPYLNWIGLTANSTVFYLYSKGVVIGSAPATFSGTVEQPTASAYFVTYDADGGIGQVPIDENAYTMGSPVKVNFSTTPTKTGYVFTGWNDGTTTYSSTGILSFAMPATDVTLTAVWTPQPSVTEDDHSTIAASPQIPPTGDGIGYIIAGAVAIVFLGTALAAMAFFIKKSGSR